MSEDIATTEGFPPIAGAEAMVLILGSLPSRQSIAKNQYYGHPRNAFWGIMGELFGAGPELPYPRRAAVVADRGVAVWDVLAASVRPGSLDADIDEATAVPNDIHRFLAEHPAIGLVCFNGKAAERLFAKLVAPPAENGSNTVEYRTLPSTSPAHAAMSFEEKLDRWRVVAEATNKKRRTR